MSKPPETPRDPKRVPVETVHRVRDACLCLHAQRAARALARRFDRALAEIGMTNGQFSLMMVLSGPEPKPPARVAAFLAMDRTSLTAMVKPLERRGWVEVRVDDKDRRGRRLALTDSGHAALSSAVPIWEAAHAALDAALPDPEALRSGLNALTFGEQGKASVRRSAERRKTGSAEADGTRRKGAAPT